MGPSVDRIARERAFHDARFAGGEDDRSTQMKCDVALKPCFDRYAKRRAELAKGASRPGSRRPAVWRSKAGQTGEGLAQNMIVTPLQGIIDYAAQLPDRLRCRHGSSGEGDEQRIEGSAIGEAAEQA